MSVFILGISFGYHDSSACLLKDEDILAAVQEERFSRIKNDRSFPIKSIVYVLPANINILELDAIVFYEDPALKLGRQLRSVFQGNILSSINSCKKVFKTVLSGSYTKYDIASLFYSYGLIPGRAIKNISSKILFSKHHYSHAASAFYPSSFSEAAVLCVDGVGEFTTTSIWYGYQSHLKPLVKIEYPHSIGLLYSAFTYFCGFKVNSGEYKLMGLAPYGKPLYVEQIKKELIFIHKDGSFKLNLDVFNFVKGNDYISKHFSRIFKMPRRQPEDEIIQFYKDLASSVQQVTEEVVYGLAKYAKSITNSSNLCLAGGVALNCVSNGKLKESDLFSNIWVQPASGDSGSSLGAAYLALYSTIFVELQVTIQATTRCIIVILVHRLHLLRLSL